jgi:DNA invertase Pin-like site-specific DNA recombinase
MSNDQNIGKPDSKSSVCVRHAEIIDSLVKEFGSYRKLANQFDVDGTTVFRWKKEIPLHWWPHVAQLAQSRGMRHITEQFIMETRPKR